MGNIAHNQVIIMTDVIGGFYLSNGNREVIIEHSSAEPLSIGGESLAFSDGGVIVAKEDGIPLFVMYTGGDIFELNRLLYTAKEVVSRFLLGKKIYLSKVENLCCTFRNCKIFYMLHDGRLLVQDSWEFSLIISDSVELRIMNRKFQNLKRYMHLEKLLTITSDEVLCRGTEWDYYVNGYCCGDSEIILGGHCRYNIEGMSKTINRVDFWKSVTSEDTIFALSKEQKRYITKYVVLKNGFPCIFKVKTLNPDRTVVLVTEDGKEIL